MANDTGRDTGGDTGHETAGSATPNADTRVIEPVVVSTSEPPPAKIERTMSFWSFLAGFLFALIAGAVGIVVFFAVSDADDDGNLELDVPAVDVDVDD